MQVREKKVSPTYKGETQKPLAMSHIFPAPIRGLVLTGSPAAPDPLSARVLDNYICTTNSIAVRGGVLKQATIDGAVVSLFTYRSGSGESMFATSGTDIYDVTSVADADVAETPVSSGLSSGYFSTCHFGTSGGNYLICVNGTDYVQAYTGFTWEAITGVALTDLSYDTLSGGDWAIDATVTGGTSGASAPIKAIHPTSATTGLLKLGTVTGGPFQDNETLTAGSATALADGASSASVFSAAITGVDTDTLSAVWSHASRLWFVEKDTDSAWYLPTSSVGGAATEFPLRTVFRTGGTLLFGTTWSMDAGDGLDDKCVFVSSEGEIAVYSGTNPASASTWALDGVYNMPRPLGKNAFIRAGGDVLIATDTGLIPLSAAIQKDISAQVAVSANIAPLWQSQARAISTEQWEIVRVPKRNLMIVSQPDTTDPDGSALCVNVQTGAWSRFTGMDTRCLTEFNDLAYYGDGDGFIHLIDSGGNDNGAPYQCTYIGQFEHIDAPGGQKTVLQAKALFRAATPINPKVSVLTNYSEILPTAPSSPDDYTADIWDSGLWDVALWDAGTSYDIFGSWQSIGATGTTIAPAIQMTFGVTPTPDAEFTSVLMQYTVGAPVG